MDWLLGGDVSGGGTLVWSASAAWTWVVVLLAAVALLAALLRRDSETRVGLGQQALEWIFWGLAVGGLAVAALGPRWIDDDGGLETAPLVVLIDGSASMSVSESDDVRSAAIAPRLKEIQAEAGTAGPVDVYTFDDEVRSGFPASYDGRGTDLGVALETITDRYLGRAVRGVVVVTDGIDRGGLRTMISASAAAGELDAGLAPSLPGPLTIVQVGSLEQVSDTAIDDVVTGGFAFLRTPFSLTARVRGVPGTILPVELSSDGRVQQRSEVTLDDEGRGETTFEVRPRRVGRFAWEVSTPVGSDDAVPGNNTFPVVVRVVRDRTRVLQVSGSPSYDQKFLRLFLKEDPSVDLVSFFILRTPEDMGAGWGGSELALIEFPYEALFTEDLRSFDLVVFQNFDYAPYFTYLADELLDNVATYVEEGGALVMTGGDRSFDLGKYQGTPLARVLPVRLGVAGQKSDEVPFRPQLTQAGQSHPITRLAAETELSASLWQTLPPLDGLNITVGPAADAAVLLTHPDVSAANGEPAPVLAVAEAGRGRSMALMVDASWRWSFSEAALGKGNQAYLRFWKNALRWLVADPDDRRVVLAPDRDNVLLGDEVQVRVNVRDAGHLPLASTLVRIATTGPDGEASSQELTTDASGEAVVTVRPTVTGAHQVDAVLVNDPAQKSSTVFAVSDRDPELDEVVPDASFLAALAALYGEDGRLVSTEDSVSLLLDNTAVRSVRQRRETDLATAPLVAIWVASFACGAWWLRRRRGAV